MAKTATQATLSPYALATGKRIYASEAQSVAEQLNYAFQNTTITYFSFVAADAGWNGDPDTMATHAVHFDGSAIDTWEVVYQGQIYVDPDVQTIRCISNADVGAASVGNVRFTIGATNGTNTHSSTSSQTVDLNTSSTGTGWLQFEIEIRYHSGAAAIQLTFITVEGKKPASIPSPISE